MVRVNVNEAQTGMVLAEDVRGATGRHLLDRGTTINDTHLRILNMWGVTEVLVKASGSSEQAGNGLPEEHVRKAEQRIKARFVNAHPDVGPMPELRRQCVISCASRLAEGWEPPSLPERPSVPIPDALQPDLDAMLSSDSGMVSLPDIYFKITRALEDPACTATRLADIISRDANMSARLLRLVNSPAMGQRHKVDTLSRAVAMLGAREISQLALGVSIMALSRGTKLGSLPVVEFWKHCLACGVFARLIAVHLKRRDLERFFVAGLLHDIGRLVMFRLAPAAMENAIHMAYAQRLPLYLTEKDMFGFDHCQVAERLMASWRLPGTLTGIVNDHHAPTASDTPQEASVINIADAMAIALEHGFSGQHLFTGMSPGAWDAIGLQDSTLAVIIMQARRQLTDIFTIFLD